MLMLMLVLVFLLLAVLVRFFEAEQQFLFPLFIISAEFLAELDVLEVRIVALDMNRIGELVVEGKPDGEEQICFAEKDGVLGVVLIVVRPLGGTEANNAHVIAADIADEVV